MSPQYELHVAALPIDVIARRNYGRVAKKLRTSLQCSSSASPQPRLVALLIVDGIVCGCGTTWYKYNDGAERSFSVFLGCHKLGSHSEGSVTKAVGSCRVDPALPTSSSNAKDERLGVVGLAEEVNQSSVLTWGDDVWIDNSSPFEFCTATTGSFIICHNREGRQAWRTRNQNCLSGERWSLLRVTR